MAASLCLTSGERKHWWLSNRKMVGRYVREARILMATQEQCDVASALGLIESALALSPRLELALELKARCLLKLQRFKEVAGMLQDYIPSLKMGSGAGSDDSGSVSSDNLSQTLSRERVRLLPDPPDRDPSFKCFSISDLKKKVMAGLSKNCDKDGQWRYSVLGQACFHLGLMEDAMVLLQTGKRLVSAAFRRESICWSEDSFSLSTTPFSGEGGAAWRIAPGSPPSRPVSESESINLLLVQIKLLIRRRTAARAALDAGLYSESIRIFGKILDGRRGAPQGFLAECYMGRASAYRAAGRVAESIADCNRTLALDPTSIQALETRAALFESIRCLTDCLHDLEHLKLLYNSILRERKLPGPAWKRHQVHYREIPGKLCALTVKTQELKKRVASRELANVDYYALIGLRRGCSRSELDRAHLLLSLRHKPDKAVSFLDRCQFSDDRDLDSIRDRAKMSALLLYRLLQRGYTTVMSNIMDEAAAEKQRTKVAAGVPAPMKPITEPIVTCLNLDITVTTSTANASVFQGVFCRDLAAVSNLLSQVGFSAPLPVKYEALSC